MESHYRPRMECSSKFCEETKKMQLLTVIRASVHALCRDGAGQISRERVQRGRLVQQGTTS